MNTYMKITVAREILELPEQATMAEIKGNYRKLIRQWHPDRCHQNQEACKEMSAKIIAAYRTIINFCNHYRFSFSQEEVRKYLTNQEWWTDRFGNDPVWGKTKEEG